MVDFSKVWIFFRFSKKLFGHVYSLTLCKQMSCKVTVTFVNTELCCSHIHKAGFPILGLL